MCGGSSYTAILTRIGDGGSPSVLKIPCGGGRRTSARISKEQGYARVCHSVHSDVASDPLTSVLLISWKSFHDSPYKHAEML